jgi:hypothetical protein
VTGPSHVTAWASPTEVVPFSRSVVLEQNSIDGLFSARHPKTRRSVCGCGTGTSATVLGFSGGEESLLLDGTFG